MGKSIRLLEKIRELQSLGIGDSQRLEHLRNSIVENKKIYSSDLQYVSSLDTETQDIFQNLNKENFCWKCEEKLLLNAKFCSFCGSDQGRPDLESDIIMDRKTKREINPIKVISNLHSYQTLAIIGGLTSLIPVLIAMTNLERIFELIEFYYGFDLTRYYVALIGVGSLSFALSAVTMVLAFLIKKPKKAGKILFFTSFGILATSLLTGIVGFAFLLVAGISALKQRRYL